MGGTSAAQKQADHESKSGPQEKLGGARADFVANLGRRRVEITAALEPLREEPGSARHRDDLRRRIHALGAGARLLRFIALSEELRRLEDDLAIAADRGSLSPADIDATTDLVARMTSLAWGQSGQTAKPTSFAPPEAPLAEMRAPVESEPAPRSVAGPISVLVVGPTSLGQALAMPVEGSAQAFEIEETGEVDVGLDLAKALAPDVVVIDGDLRGATDLVESLASDPLTELLPIIVTGRFARSEDAAKFAALGVAKSLPKPVSASDLRCACVGVLASYVRHEMVRESLGDVNLDQLGARLAEELRRGLCDAADDKARASQVDLGEGTEVLAALWGAVARIRDIVTIKSKGAVRFAAGGPEGAMPIATFGGFQDSPGASRSNSRAPRVGSEVSLEKTTIVVADDDPAVNWFLAGVLKAAGASVYEARDGERAFEVAKHVEPDLVISDILMPKLDGFALCRALKRDVVLRDVPVVLLSWKEDLLQRVRELGVDADGYMRKEASAGTVVQRVKELLRQRRRVSERIASGGEVRGRLDGLTTTTLLRMVAKHRPDASVSVRDASYLYEVELRQGRPIRATRTATLGSFERGSSVLASLLGCGDGRFVVAPAREDEEVAKVRADLSGTLTEQLTPVIASARAAQRLLMGPNLVRVQRVGVDEERLEAYLVATPKAAQEVLKSIAGGASPRSLITSGQVAPRLLEDVLGDAAIHGAICEVLDAQGFDRLPEGTAHELAILRGERAAQPIMSIPVLAVPALTPFPAPALEVSMPLGNDLFKAALSGRSTSLTSPVASSLPYDPTARPDMQPAFGASSLDSSGSDPMPAISASAAEEGSVDVSVFDVPAPGSVPMQLLDAVLGVAPLPAAPEAPVLPPLAPQRVDEPSMALDDAWFDAEPKGEEESPVAPSGPRQITPPPAQQAQQQAFAVREPTPTPSRLPPPPGLKPMLTLGSLHPPPVSLEPEVEPAKKQKSPPPPPASKKDRESTKAAKESKDTTPSAPFVDRRQLLMPSAYLPSAPQAAKKDRKALYWVIFALCGVSFAVWARWSRDKSIVSEDALRPPVAAQEAPAQAGADDAPATETTSKPADPATPDKPNGASPTQKGDDAAPEDLPLRDGDKDRVKKGQGLLEVVAGKSDSVYIDGKPMGSGPIVSAPLKAKNDPYEVKVKLRGEERVRFVSVKEGRITRVRIAPPWSR